MKKTHMRILLVVFITTGFVISFPLIGNVGMYGLDPSYGLALNYSFANLLDSNILFTYGPFGFLFFPFPVGDNLLYAFAFHIPFHLFFIAMYFFLVAEHVEYETGLVAVAGMCAGLFFVVFSPPIHRLLIISIILILHLVRSSRIYNIVFLSSITAFLLFTKNKNHPYEGIFCGEFIRSLV